LIITAPAPPVDSAALYSSHRSAEDSGSRFTVSATGDKVRIGGSNSSWPAADPDQCMPSGTPTVPATPTAVTSYLVVMNDRA